MDRISLQSLLKPCVSDGGVGQNLEYDSRHLAMCQLAEGTPEQEYGQTLVAAQQPNWRMLHEMALELSVESRDLRVAVYLTESLCRLQGFAGLADGLELILGWTTQYWSDLYPQLDAADNNDPVERLGALNRLCRSEYLLSGLQRLTLASSDALGRVTLQDLKQLASTPEERANGLTREEIQAIFLSEELEQLRQTGDSIAQCIDAVEQLSGLLDERIGVGQWDASPLLRALYDCRSAVENAHGARSGPVASHVAASSPNVDETQAQSLGDASPGTKAVAMGLDADDGILKSPQLPVQKKLVIGTRAEAMAVLDGLCAYFETHEPASPVPLLLQRAKRLIPMSFVDILRELAPDGLQQAMQSVGASRGET